MNLIGPISLTYYEKIKVNENDERNILLLGDRHFDVYFSKKCCNHDEIMNKLREYHNNIQTILDLLEIGKILFNLPNIFNLKTLLFIKN